MTTPSAQGPAGDTDTPFPEQVATLTWNRGDWPAELATDADWQSAAHGEEWALLRLGQERDRLAQLVETGGPAGYVAIRAWSFAEVAWEERGVLCRVLPRYVAADWGPVLVALRESSTQRERFGEALDPDAAFACERTFQWLDRRVGDMSPAIFDEYTATCQAIERPSRLKTE